MDLWPLRTSSKVDWHAAFRWRSIGSLALLMTLVHLSYRVCQFLQRFYWESNHLSPKYGLCAQERKLAFGG